MMKYFLMFYLLGILWLTYFEVKSKQPKQQTPTIQPTPTEAEEEQKTEDTENVKYI